MPRRLAAFTVVLLLLLLAFGSTACRSGKGAPTVPSSTASLGTSGGFAPAPGGAPARDFDSSAATIADEGDARVATEAEPGLGTAFGEHRHSQIVSAPFVRESSRPEALLSLFYDDVDGVRALGRMHGGQIAPASALDAGGGALVVALLDENGQRLTAADIDGRRIVVGQPGQRYVIAIENNSRERWEVVASVDGLDVIDGERAAFHKRGYVVDPFSSVAIEGWRTSSDSVAAFRFAALSESFASRTGQANNVGVVGVAFFRERGAARFDSGRTEPFPARFTAPPPPRF